MSSTSISPRMTRTCLALLMALSSTAAITSPATAQVSEDQWDPNDDPEPSGDPLCGNLTCDPLETHESCPVDCDPPIVCESDYCVNCEAPTALEDNDEDGIDDGLEFALAHHYYPDVRLASSSDDLGEAYVHQGYPTPFTVAEYQDGTTHACDEAYECLEIRIPILFSYDHGFWSTGLGAHEGDSEFYIALVRRELPFAQAQDPSAWSLIRDFTSAHWDTSVDKSETGAYGLLEYDGCYGTAAFPNAQAFCNSLSNVYSCSFFSECAWRSGPVQSNSQSLKVRANAPVNASVVLWSAVSKHALYHSFTACNAGLPAMDLCWPSPDGALRDHIDGMLQNAGRADHHHLMDGTIDAPNPCYLYDVWSGLKFGNSGDLEKRFTHEFGWSLP